MEVPKSTKGYFKLKTEKPNWKILVDMIFYYLAQILNILYIIQIWAKKYM